MIYKHIKGFSLVEVLIAFVILVVGLLGATTLVIRSSQANMTAYQTEQVALVVSSFVEKIRFNNDDNALDKYTEHNGGAEQPGCINNYCSSSNRALLDMKIFQDQLNQLGLANSNPTWDFEVSSVKLNDKDYSNCNLLVKWGEGDTKNSYRVNFMILKTTP